LNYGTASSEDSRLLDAEVRKSARPARRSLYALEAKCGHSASESRLADELIEITAELLRRNRFHSDIYVRPAGLEIAQPSASTRPRDSFTIVACPSASTWTRQGLHAGITSWRRLRQRHSRRAKILRRYVNSAWHDDCALRLRRGHFLSETARREGALQHFMVRKGA